MQEDSNNGAGHLVEGQVEERGVGCEGGQGRHVWRGKGVGERHWVWGRTREACVEGQRRGEALGVREDKGSMCGGVKEGRGIGCEGGQGRHVWRGKGGERHWV